MLPPSHGWSTLVDLLRWRAQQQPDQEACTFLVDGEQDAVTLSYAALDRHARAIAAHLQQMDLGGQRALLIHSPGPQYIAALFGALFAGMVVIPAYPPQSTRSNRSLIKRFRAIFEDVQPAIVLATGELVEQRNLISESVPALGTVPWLATEQLDISRAQQWVAPNAEAASLAILQYTSGSTTTPKGVMLSHENVLHNSAFIHQAFGHSAASQGVMWLPPYHDMGLIGGIIQPIYGGFPVTLLSPIAFVERPLRWLEAISRTRATTSGGPSFAYDLCERRITPEQRSHLDLSSWQVAFNGAEPIRPEVLERFAAAFEPCGFRREAFFPCYGLAEATVMVSGGAFGHGSTTRSIDTTALEQNRVMPPTTPVTERTLVSCGRTASDVQLVVVDPVTGNYCAPDHVGEIWVAGTSVAMGYWGRAAEIADTFHAFVTNDGAGPFLRTGDMGFIADGELYIAGRLKELIIIRGRNHYPHDIEQTAEQSHPALKSASGAAFAVDIDGEERLVLVQEVERRFRRQDLSEVVATVRASIAQHHAIQAYAVVLMQPGSVPRTSSGKVQRGICRERYLAGELEALTTSTLQQRKQTSSGPPMSSGTLMAASQTARQAVLEHYLRELIAKTLKVSRDDLLEHQALTAMGLDSLGAVELRHQIQRELGVELPAADLLGDESLSQLSARLHDLVEAPAASSDETFLSTRGQELSSGEQTLWFIHKLSPRSGAYNLAMALRAGPELDLPTLRQTLDVLTERHQALRMTIEAGPPPTRRIHERGNFDFEVVDASSWSNEFLEEQLIERAYRPFDLERGPLLRLHVARLTDGRSVLLIVVHHIAVDFWSLAILGREFAEIYLSLRAGRRPTLSIPRGIDEVRRQQQVLANTRVEQLRNYWGRQLADAPQRLNLPTDRPRPAIQTYRGGSFGFSIDPKVYRQIEEICLRYHVTPFMVLLATYQVLLGRYTGQRDLLVGVPMAGRSHAEQADTVGYFVNSTVLRARMAHNPSFTGLLMQTRETVLDAQRHQDYPFAQLVEQLCIDRDPSMMPLFQAMLVMQKAQLADPNLAAVALGEAGATLSLGGLHLETHPLRERVVQCDLQLMVADRGDSLSASLQYNLDLFDDATAARMAVHFQTLLAAALANPEIRIDQLQLIGDEERELLIHSWSNAPGAPSTNLLIHQIVEIRATQHPDDVAVIFEQSQLTYRQLNERANQLAHYLRRNGAGTNTVIGISLRRSLDLPVTVLGIMKAGAAFVALDADYPPARLALLLEDVMPQMVLTQAAVVPNLPLSQVQTICLDLEQEAISRESCATLALQVSPDQLSYVIYTSGTTGEAKGIAMPYRTFAKLVSWQLRMSPGGCRGRTLQFARLNFDVSLQEMFSTWCAGGTLVLISEEFRHDLQGLLRLIDQEEIERVFLPFIVLHQIAELAGIYDIVPRALREIITAGEQLQITRPIAALVRQLGHCVIDNQYGPSEAPFVTAERLEGDPALWPVLPPIGRVLQQNEVYILDSQLQPAPIGVPGEIYVGGVQLALGYHNRPALTAEYFIPNPFSVEHGARLYRSGDLARFLADGAIEFLGRVDQQVKINGVRVELGEIEARIGRHPMVQEAAVTLRGKAPARRQLVAYFVPVVGTYLSGADLRRFVRAELPNYMVPTVVVELSALPLTPNGKIDRRALPEPPSDTAVRAESWLAPATELELVIATIWCEVLKVERVAIDTNFFDLGGHSLSLLQVQTQLYSKLDRNVPIVELFRYPTVSTLAEHLSNGKSERALPNLHPMTAKDDQSIAIIGMSGRFPGARDLDHFWSLLRDGRESISDFTRDELLDAGLEETLLNHPDYVKRSGVIEDAEAFDAAFFGINPREAEIMDPQQRVFLECAWETLEHAGYDSERYSQAIGVFAGSSMNTYLIFNLATNPELLDSVGHYQIMLSNDKDFLATRVSYKLNLRGPSITVQSACSTSLVAVHMACKSLLAGECDMALAGGVALRYPSPAGYLYSADGILSPDGKCRAFDEQSQGTVPGSGVGAVLLKPLSRAISDGDTIHAVIKSSAVNNDGSSKVGYTAPSVEGQRQVIITALTAAGINPETISYVEAHGTGTALGDPIEIAALTEAYQTFTDRQNFCAVASVKSNIGHADIAAGIAGLIKAVLALKHREIPPSLHVNQVNAQLRLEGSPFYVNTRLMEWETGGAPRRAAVSALGIGGTNAHAILEEAPEASSVDQAIPFQLVVLSARSELALQSITSRLTDHVCSTEVSLADLATTLQQGRRAFKYRSAMVCSSRDDLLEALRNPNLRQVIVGESPPSRPKIAFLFPGQGTQYVGMASGIYDHEPTFRADVDRCIDILQAELGLDLRDVLFPDDANQREAAHRLSQTVLAQPVLFVIEYALARLLIERGIEPDVMLGHSIGEYVAACLAGVFSLKDALLLVAARGSLMQQLPVGSMLAVPLSPEELAGLMGNDLSLAAVNGPNLSIVSGPSAAIERIERILATRHVESQRLHASHAFHSAMMDPILEEFTERVARVTLRPPVRRYLSNLTGKWITNEQATDPSYWAAHMRQTVRFADGVRNLLQQPNMILLEVGPGQTLSTSVWPLLSKEQHSITTMRHPREQEADSKVLLAALGRLWVAGVELNWEHLKGQHLGRRIPLPTYPFERQRFYVPPRRLALDDVKATAVKRATDLSQWFYIPSWRRTLPPLIEEGAFRHLSRCWLIFVDGLSVGEEIAILLEHESQTVIAVSPGPCFVRSAQGRYQIRPGEKEDYLALLRDLHAQGTLPQRIVHLWSYTELADEETDPKRFSAAQDLGYYSLLYLVQALEQLDLLRQFTNEQQLELTLVGSGLHALTDSEICAPEKALLLGSSKVLPQEFPMIACRNLDIQAPSFGSLGAVALAELLLGELVSRIQEPGIAYRGRQRWVETFEATPLAPGSRSSPTLRTRGVYLITGGLGKLGLLLAENLVSRYQARLTLVGRSPLPPREEWDDWIASHNATERTSSVLRELQRLEALGGEIFVQQADVTNNEQMRSVVADTMQRFGTLHGVIHAAADTSGRSMFNSIGETDRQSSEEQFGPKIHGTYVLGDVLSKLSLDFCVLFSSNASILGGLGFFAYAASNRFLDAFAASRSARSKTRWISVNWDVWQSATISYLHPSSLQLEQYLIAPADGLEAFQRIVDRAPVSQISVSPTSLPSRIDRWVTNIARFEQQSSESTRLTGYARPALSTSYVTPISAIDQKIVALWRELLGIEVIGLDDDFFDLGGNSLLAIQLISRLRDAFEIKLSVRSLFDAPTVRNVVKMIVEHLARIVDEAQLVTIEHLTDEETLMQLRIMGTPNERSVTQNRSTGEGAIGWN